MKFAPEHRTAIIGLRGLPINFQRISTLFSLARLLLLSALVCFAPSFVDAEDSPWLYGIHWYGDTGQSDVEAMSGGKPIYVTDQVFTAELGQGNSWELPAQKNIDWGTITGAGKGHTIIARLQPNWGRQIPLASDSPYTLTQYVSDAGAAANTLKNVCHIWQVGNEMNILAEQSGAQLQATDYVNAYLQISAAIHAVASPLGDQIVLLGPLSPGDVIAGVRWRSGDDYLNDMLTLLSPSQVDGIALHAYGAGAPDAAVSGWIASISEQLAIVKTRGFGDKAVYLTEWNRHTPTQSEEAASAQFLYKAFAALHDWNTAPGNQNIVGATWFVYPSGVGWDDYSIQFYTTVGGTKDNDLWAAFNFAASQNFPAGRVGSNSLAVNAGWVLYE